MTPLSLRRPARLATLLAALLVPASAAAGPQRAQQRIINGEAATSDDHPNAGALLAELPAQAGGDSVVGLICSSTLIAPDVVLLAAHCVDPNTLQGSLGLPFDQLTFLWSRQADLSSYDFQSPQGRPADAVEARVALRHPRYQSVDIGLTLNYDIALLFLDEPVLDVEPAWLLQPGEEEQVLLDAPVVVVGWGQQTHVPFGQPAPPGSTGIKQMGDSFISELADFEFKVGEVASDVRKCHGDSGGPSFMDVDNPTYPDPVRLIGVTSHAYDLTDCSQTGGVDTRVDYFLDWIEDELIARCEDGSRAWCDVPGILEPPRPIHQGPEAGPPPFGGCDLRRDPALVDEIAGIQGPPPESSAAFAGGLLLLGLLGLGRRRRS